MSVVPCTELSESVYVLFQTRKAASWLAEKMTADGHSVALLSGEITVEQRIAVLNRFRDGKEKLLITTNVCARGIDVEQVNTCDSHLFNCTFWFTGVTRWQITHRRCVLEA